MDADIIVAGGLFDPYGTCPFPYTYISSYEDLLAKLRQYNAVLYHWPTKWAVLAIQDSGLPCVEFVHRTDTAECDKTVPHIIVSHSQYVCNYIQTKYNRSCLLVSNVVDTDFYTPCNDEKPKAIGAVISYYDTKGIDILIKGWKLVQNDFPNYRFVLYGAGDQREKYETMAKRENVRMEFHGPVNNSKIVYDKIRLVVTASRIEGLPIALLEALSCNLPILASDIEGHSIINKLCEEQSLPIPLKLFRSDNIHSFAESLHEAIEALEHDASVNTRQIALQIFSPKQHTEGLLKALEKAEKINSTDRNYKLILIKKLQNIEPEIYSIDTALCQPYKYDFMITNKNYLLLHANIESKATRITINAEIQIVSQSNLYYQIDFRNAHDDIIVTDFSGILLDAHVKRLHAAFTVPMKASNFTFVIRPNPGEFVKVSHIDINLYKYTN